MSNKDENVTVVVKWWICFILYTLIFLSKWSWQLLLTKSSWHVIRERLNDGVIHLSRILIRVGDWSLQVCLHFCSYYHTPLIKTPLKITMFYILYFSLSAPLKNLIINKNFHQNPSESPDIQDCTSLEVGLISLYFAFKKQFLKWSSAIILFLNVWRLFFWTLLSSSLIFSWVLVFDHFQRNVCF